jgi:hypothetical protein
MPKALKKISGWSAHLTAGSVLRKAKRFGGANRSAMRRRRQAAIVSVRATALAASITEYRHSDMT